MGMVN